MNQSQIAYLQARKLEAYFREKIDLRFKATNGNFAEYEVTQVNNRPVKFPITVGFSEHPTDAQLYLSTDLTRDHQGIAKIDFNLSGDTLRGLDTGQHKILFLDALQTAVSNRFLVNAEEIAGQSLLRSVSREYQKTIRTPFHQLRDVFRFVTGTFPGGPFGKPLGNTVKQSKYMHIIHNANSLRRMNVGLRNRTKGINGAHDDFPASPVVVHSTNAPSFAQLNSNIDYELSFSRDCSRGIPHAKCTLTPIDKDISNHEPVSLQYNGIRLTEKELELYLPSAQTITLSLSDRNRTAHLENLDITHDKHQQSIEPHAKDVPLSFKMKEKASLDSMIASAQSRARDQASHLSTQRDHVTMTGREH